MPTKKVLKRRLLSILNRRRLRTASSGRKIKVVNMDQRAVINTEVQAGRK
jgi:hypothetical protein